MMTMPKPTTVSINVQVLSANMGDYTNVEAATEDFARALRAGLAVAAVTYLGTEPQVTVTVDVQNKTYGATAPSSVDYEGDEPQGWQELASALDHLECNLYAEWMDGYQG
jgi:hypothetical protein